MSSSISDSESPATLSPRRFLAWMGFALVAGFALLWVYVARCPLGYLNGAFVYATVQRETIAACDLGDVVIFGDSRAQAAFAPEHMTVRARNFALAGTNPVETWFAVDQMLRCPNPPRLVVLAHSPFALQEPVKLWTSDDLALQERREIEQTAARLGDLASLEPNPPDGLPMELRDLGYEVRFPPFYFAALLHGGVAVRWWSNQELLEKARKGHGHGMFGTLNGSDGIALEAGMTGFRVPPLIDHFFARIVKELDRRSIRVVLLTPPMNEATYAALKPEVIAGFTAYMERMAKNTAGFQVAGAPLPCWPNRYFGDDSSHLNETGSAAYTAWVDTLLTATLTHGAPPVEMDSDGCVKADKVARLASLPR